MGAVDANGRARAVRVCEGDHRQIVRSERDAHVACQRLRRISPLPLDRLARHRGDVTRTDGLGHSANLRCRMPKLEFYFVHRRNQYMYSICNALLRYLYPMQCIHANESADTRTLESTFCIGMRGSVAPEEQRIILSVYTRQSRSQHPSLVFIT